MKPEDAGIFNALTDEQAMANTMRWEAGTEYKKVGRPAFAAVGWVIMNRAQHGRWYPTTIKGVCYQHAAFSFYLSESVPKGYANALEVAKDFEGYMAYDKLLEICLEVARGVLSGREPNPIGPATDYVNASIVTGEILEKWARGKQHVASVGAHEFYTEV